MGYGNNTVVGIAFQNSYGTAANVNSAHYVPHLSETIQKKIPPLISESMRGILDEGESYEGPHTVEGDFDSEANGISLGALFKCVLNLNASVNSGGIYTHTFKPHLADWDEKSSGYPFTMFVDRDVSSRTLAYHSLNGAGLEIGIANGELMKAKVTVVGGDVNSLGELTPTYPTGRAFTWDVASTSIGGTGKDEIVNMSIKVNETMEPQHTLDGSKAPNRIKRTGFRTVMVDGTLKFDNMQEYDQFVAQSERAFVMTFTGVEVQSGYNETITIKLPKMRYEDNQGNASGPGQIEASFSAKGKYSVTSATALEIVVVNTQATY